MKSFTFVLQYSEPVYLFLQFCPSSCPAQAWSAACILEVLYDLEEVGMVDDIAPRRNSADLSQKTVLV